MFLALLAPTAALAHPGDHGDFSVGAFLAHMLSEPDHLAMITGCRRCLRLSLSSAEGHANDPRRNLPAAGDIELNAGCPSLLMVANTGDRPVQVGSHYHFAETNARPVL